MLATPTDYFSLSLRVAVKFPEFDVILVFWTG